MDKEKKLAARREYRKKNRQHFLDKDREYRSRSRGKRLAAAAEWRKKNPERLAAYYKTQYARKKAFYVDYNRASALRRNYGITIEQYESMYRDQNGSCAVCVGVNISGRRLAVDHDHKTGKIRGLLCSRCNSAIGLARESKDILLDLFQYLDKHEALSCLA